MVAENTRAGSMGSTYILALTASALHNQPMPSALLIDAVVLLAYFGLILWIGLSQRSKSGSMEGFALGDRQIAWWAVLASILAAEISAGTFFGAPGEGYALRTFTYIQLIVGYLLARVVVSAVFIPAYYRHGVVSIYEFLGTRFGPVTHRLSSGVFLITRLLASGTRLRKVDQLPQAALHVCNGCLRTPQPLRAVRSEGCSR